MQRAAHRPCLDDSAFGERATDLAGRRPIASDANAELGVGRDLRLDATQTTDDLRDRPIADGVEEVPAHSPREGLRPRHLRRHAARVANGVEAARVGSSDAREKKSAIPAAKLALYEKLIATDARIVRKGATIPYTSANGKMFSYLSPTGDLRLRLPEADRLAFEKKYGTKPVIQHGVLMKDWVAVPAVLAGRIAELKPYLALSRAYAERLGTKKSMRAAPRAAKRRG